MIMYDCTDSSGNAATQATRQVTVQDSTCPTCTFTDADNQDIILEASFPFTDPAFGTNPDVSCTDELNTNLTPTATYLESDKTTVTTVDQITANTGKYYVTYIVTDDVGNTNEIKTDKTDTDAATGKVSGSTTKSCTFQTLSTATTADPTATLTAMDYDASSYTRTIEVKDTLRPVIKLKYGDTEIKAGTPNAIAHKGDNAGYDHQTFEAKSSAYQHQGLFAPKAASLMAEESQESVNGWVLGAIASAVSGLALLGYSLRKQAQPVATSVPV